MYNQAKNTCTKTPSGRTVHSNMFDSTFDREEQSRAKANGRGQAYSSCARSPDLSPAFLLLLRPAVRPSVRRHARFPISTHQRDGRRTPLRRSGSAGGRARMDGRTDGGTNARVNGTGEQVGSRGPEGANERRWRKPAEDGGGGGGHATHARTRTAERSNSKGRTEGRTDGTDIITRSPRAARRS